MTRRTSRRAPVSTYRLQLRPEFGFTDAADVVPYLARLGVSHLYLSPVLQAAPGSTHGYDVVDHTVLSEALGGRAAFERLVTTAHAHGLGLVVDVVPNHMCVPTPAYLNTKLWAVLRDGPDSPYARWFDIDWSLGHSETAGGHGAILMPVLGRRVDQCLADGEIAVGEHDGEPVLRYFDHVFPIRPGTADLPLPELLDRQFYRLAYWRLADDELNYRRFFDVDTLAGVRVEDPDVFSASHDLLLQLYADGEVDGFRIDHPDGLADPRGYLRRLAEATGGGWVVAEKILERAETLPGDWPCAGTTGYDALWRLQSLFLRPDGVAAFRARWHERTGEPPTIDAVVEAGKRHVVEEVLAAEVERLVDQVDRLGGLDIGLRDFSHRRLTEALRELLVAFPVYRAYVVPGEEPPPESVDVVRNAAATACRRAPELADEVELLADLALGVRHGPTADLREPDLAATLRAEICVRFQQTTGPVLAKGIEDTAYYRWFPLTALTEVGSDPHRDGVEPAELHAWASRRAAEEPDAMTTLSTHDTKRSEDVRARLCALSERPAAWADAVDGWAATTAVYRPKLLDAATEELLWQTLVGAWPIDADRLAGYLEKATREAKLHTSWTDPDPAYDEAVASFARQVRADEAVTEAVEEFVAGLAASERAIVLGQRLLALTCPGVPDTYQGTELVDRSLVDPDNRRPVDYARRAELLDRLDDGDAPRDLAEEKLWIGRQAMRARRDHPGCFVGPAASYEPLPSETPHVFGFLRGDRFATLVTRHAGTLVDAGGFGTATVTLPPGRWSDLLTGTVHDTDASGRLAAAGVLTDLPVALLAHEGRR